LVVLKIIRGYNGVFLGVKDAGWHLEFTTSVDAPQHQPDEDDLLVFYQKNAADYEALKLKFEQHNISPVPAKTHIGIKMAPATWTRMVMGL